MSSLKYVNDNKSYKIALPIINIPSQYPSEWFIAHHNKKPTAKYNKGGVTPDNLTKIVLAGIKSHVLSVDLVKYFLHTYMIEITETLSESWKSFGVTIGMRGEDINPLSPINIEISNTTMSNLAEVAARPEDRKWMVMCLLAASRLTNIPVQSYFDAIRDRIFKMMKNEGCTLPAFPPSSLYDPWVLDDGYSKMVASIDMFFAKFPNNPNSVLRISTLRSRFKDCSSLLSIGYITELLDLEGETAFLEWIWTDKMAKEMIQMIHSGEETMMADSYFPYQSDLKLVNKTYYSASKNPQVYFLIHAVGTLLHSTRSKNAKFLSDNNIMNNIQCAKIMAFAFSSVFSLEQAFTADGNRVIIDQGEEEEDIDTPPETTSGAAWYLYMAARGFKLTHKMVEFINHAKNSIGETRADTIGEYVKNNF